MVPSDFSSPIQWPRQPPILSLIISHSSFNFGPLFPQAPIASFHNPIVIEEDDSNKDTMLHADNTWCSRCHWYIYNNHHSKDYCDTDIIPGAPVMICQWCGLHGHLMLDCRETVCTWCDRLDDCPNLEWTISNLGFSKVARVVLWFYLLTCTISFFFTITFRTTCHKHMFFLLLSFPMHNMHVTC